MHRKALLNLRRWSLNIGSAIGLLLFVTTVGLWVWSHYDAWDVMLVRQGLAVDRRTDVWQYALTNLPGTLEIHWSHSCQDGPFEIPEELGAGESGVLRSVQFHHSDPANAPTGTYDPTLRRLGLWLNHLKGTRLDLPSKPSYNVLRVGLADWLLMELFIALPVARVQMWRRERRRRARLLAGRCPRCGYDLRATPEHCPECGMTPAGHPTAA